MFFRKRTETHEVEWLIVGLGNPGPEYRNTRHNIGFDVIDALAHSYRIHLRERKHRAVFGAGEMLHKRVVLAKPMTYMNLSGQAVAALSKSLGVAPNRVLVIADDLDMDLGKVRVRERGSSGGHNGHKSIIVSLRTQDYPRIKIGIGRGGATIDHVLSKFEPDEQEFVENAIQLACTRSEEIVGGKLVLSLQDDEKSPPS